jgi:hypothetical protein
VGDAGTGRSGVPFGIGPVGVRWSRMVEVGLGRLSRKGPRVGGTMGAPVKDRRCELSPLLGAMAAESTDAQYRAQVPRIAALP